MKKIAPIVALAIVAASFASCKKTYTCNCTYTISGVSQTYSWTTAKMKKKDAETACKNYTTAGWAGISCSLK